MTLRRVAALMSHREIKLDDRQFTLISKAIADPKRFEMLHGSRLKDAPTCSCICDWTGLAPATVSHHLKELDYAGLVKSNAMGSLRILHLAVMSGMLTETSFSPVELTKRYRSAPESF